MKPTAGTGAGRRWSGDDSGFVTGHALVVDGGMSAGQMWPQQMRWIDMIESALEGGHETADGTFCPDDCSSAQKASDKTTTVE